jgi:hypothetical protein
VPGPVGQVENDGPRREPDPADGTPAPGS